MSFQKSLCSGHIDSIDVYENGGWLHITQHVGRDVDSVRMILRSEEAIRDLHYALSRYLDTRTNP